MAKQPLKKTTTRKFTLIITLAHYKPLCLHLHPHIKIVNYLLECLFGLFFDKLFLTTQHCCLFVLLFTRKDIWLHSTFLMQIIILRACGQNLKWTVFQAERFGYQHRINYLMSCSLPRLYTHERLVRRLKRLPIDLLKALFVARIPHKPSIHPSSTGIALVPSCSHISTEMKLRQKAFQYKKKYE